MRILIIHLLLLNFSCFAQESYSISYDKGFDEVVIKDNTAGQLSFEIKGNERSISLNCPEETKGTYICKVSKLLFNKKNQFIIHSQNDLKTLSYVYEVSSLIH